MATGDYRLTLAGPDGAVVFEREIAPQHVEGVARLLRDNMDLVMAVRGGMKAASGIHELLQLADTFNVPAPRRSKGRR